MHGFCSGCGEIYAALGPLIVILAIFFFLLVFIAVLVIKAVVCCKIFHKTGWHWALGLLMLVPVACIIMPFILAFAKWPIEKQLQQLQQQQGKRST